MYSDIELQVLSGQLGVNNRKPLTPVNEVADRAIDEMMAVKDRIPKAKRLTHAFIQAALYDNYSSFASREKLHKPSVLGASLYALTHLGVILFLIGVVLLFRQLGAYFILCVVASALCFLFKFKINLSAKRAINTAADPHVFYRRMITPLMDDIEGFYDKGRPLLAIKSPDSTKKGFSEAIEDPSHLFLVKPVRERITHDAEPESAWMSYWVENEQHMNRLLKEKRFDIEVSRMRSEDTPEIT